VVLLVERCDTLLSQISFMISDMKTISLKLDKKQLKLLNELSRATKTPKSALIRKGIRLVLIEAKKDVITANLKREIDSLLREDSNLLKRLSKS
jgi:flagellar motor component MotA